jgi:hypothetical protein
MNIHTFRLACLTILAVLLGCSVRGEHVRDMQFSEPLRLHWRDIHSTGVTDRRNRFKEVFRVTRSVSEGSSVRVRTLDPGNVLFGENALVVGLGNSSDAVLNVTVHLDAGDGAEIAGGKSKEVTLSKRSAGKHQGEAKFTYKLKEIGKAVRFSVRVVDGAGNELCSASRGVLQPYAARLYAYRC